MNEFAHGINVDLEKVGDFLDREGLLDFHALNAL
jgi:hypothetical protein